MLGKCAPDCIPTSRDRFSKPGKTILDPSRRTVHSQPGLSADRPGDEKATAKNAYKDFCTRPLYLVKESAGMVYLSVIPADAGIHFAGNSR